MRNLIVSEFISLDGVIHAPGGKDEDRDGGFEHGGWTTPCWHDDIVRSLLVMTLLAHDLVDRPHLLVYPPDDASTNFTLQSARPYPTGVVGLDYVRRIA